jgi:hypothetical protein
MSYSNIKTKVAVFMLDDKIINYFEVKISSEMLNGAGSESHNRF